MTSGELGVRLSHAKAAAWIRKLPRRWLGEGYNPMGFFEEPSAHLGSPTRPGTARLACRFRF